MGKKTKSKKPTSDLPPIEGAGGAVDDELMDDLLAELDSRDQTVSAESANVLQEINLQQQATVASPEPLPPSSTSIPTSTSAVPTSPPPAKKDAKSRFKARQARKLAAAEANYTQGDVEAEARIASEIRFEEESISKTCKELDVAIHEVNPDGHCLFSSVADQLALLALLPSSAANYSTTRAAASSYILSHADDFLPFLPSIDGEDGAGSTDDGLMSPAQLEVYCKAMRETSNWGGEPEIQALARAYGVPIHVVQAGTPTVVVHNPDESFPAEARPGDKAVRISYHRRMYGLGEHYNSLRPVPHRSTLSQLKHDLGHNLGNAFQAVLP